MSTVGTDTLGNGDVDREPMIHMIEEESAHLYASMLERGLAKVLAGLYMDRQARRGAPVDEPGDQSEDILAGTMQVAWVAEMMRHMAGGYGHVA